MVSPHILIDRALESLTHPASKKDEAIIVQKMISDFLIGQAITIAEFDHHCGRLNKIAQEAA